MVCKVHNPKLTAFLCGMLLLCVKSVVLTLFQLIIPDFDDGFRVFSVMD